MQFNKIKGVVIASIIVISVGVIQVKAEQRPSIVSSTESSATDLTETTSKVTPIVVSSTKYKEVTLLSKTDIQQITDLELTSKNIYSVYKQLKKASTWEEAGYSENDAKLIATRFKKSYKQSTNILKKLANANNLNLKVVVINKPNYKNASIGVDGDDTSSEVTKPETTPVTTPTPSEEATNSSLKELEIDIDYKAGDIELEYEVKSDGTIKAKYQNDLTGEVLKGKEAQEKIESMLSGLNIKESDRTTIENHIIDKLDLKTGYKQFQFEAQFNDGKEIEFKK